ncbi:MAG: hypothetical protein VX112_05095 [Pseudomonadota bacterium]|nr:hypothetical protein [Pseudomonadota bacterium]
MSWPWDWFNLTNKHSVVHRPNYTNTNSSSLVSSELDHSKCRRKASSPVSITSVDDDILRYGITKDTPYVVRYVYAVALLSRYSNSSFRSVSVSTVLLNSRTPSCGDSHKIHPLQKIICPDAFQKYSFFIENESIYDLIMRQIFTLCSDRYENESSYRVKLRLNAFLQVLGCGLKGGVVQGDLVQSCMLSWVTQLHNSDVVKNFKNLPFDLHRLDFMAKAPFDRYGINMSICGETSPPDPIKALRMLLALYGNVDKRPLYVLNDPLSLQSYESQDRQPRQR